MNRFRYSLILLALLCTCTVAAWLLADWLAVEFKVALLICMVVTYVLISAVVEGLRVRLRRRMAHLSEEEKAALAGLSRELRYAVPSPGTPSPKLTTLAGAISINGMVLPLFVGPLAILRYVFDISD